MKKCLVNDLCAALSKSIEHTQPLWSRNNSDLPDTPMNVLMSLTRLSKFARVLMVLVSCDKESVP